MRKKVLFFCAHVPSPRARQAGHKIAYSNLLNLSHNYDVDLFIVGANLNLFDREFEQLSKITSSIKCFPFSKFHKVLGILLGFLHGFAPRFSTRFSPAVANEIRRYSSKFKYEYIWLEWSQSFWVANFLPKNIPVVMSLQDLQVTLVSTKTKIESTLFLGLTFCTEKKLLHRANKIFVLSKSEKLILTNFYKFKSNTVEVLSPPLSEFINSINRTNKTIEPHSLLFWGAMSRPENYKAVKNFLAFHFSKILAQYPDARIYIVGSAPPDSLMRLASKSILITGYVEDPAEYFAKASIGIAPLSEGAGIKLKVLEMLKAGMPVVASPVGAEGIDENSNLTVCESELFADVIIKLWANASRE